jgi:hypothetical protein
VPAGEDAHEGSSSEWKRGAGEVTLLALVEWLIVASRYLAIDQLSIFGRAV